MDYKIKTFKKALTWAGLILAFIFCNIVATENIVIPEKQIPTPALFDAHFYIRDPRTALVDQTLKLLNVKQSELAHFIMDTAIQYDLDPYLIIAVLKQESDFRQNVVSHKGAIGMAQIMPFWARKRGFDPKLLKDLRININTCGYVLRYYLDKFDGHKFKAVRAYFGQCEAGTRYAKEVFSEYEGIFTL